MQLKPAILFLLMISCLNVMAQNKQEPLYKPQPRADFLFNYYEQDGNHSAVTGGTGTERLIDRSSRIIVNVPIDTLGQLLINFAYNHYSSASTDRIDSEVSSASSRDGRARFNVQYDKESKNRKWTNSFQGGSSIESDYLSGNIGAGIGRNFNSDHKVYIGINAFFDRWLIYPPEEFRSLPNTVYKTDKRRTYDLEINWKKVISKRIQISVSVSPTLQEGLLSTPFHRVYFDNGNPAIEQLPSQRMKLPVIMKANYFLGQYIVLRTNYRYAYDDWLIRSHTLEIETAIKPVRMISFYPFYRFHMQTASKYFSPIFVHAMPAIANTDVFYTSDYDLSSFSSNAYGIGVNYHSKNGIFKFNSENRNSNLRFDQVEIRYSRYERSDGLHSAAVGINLGVVF